MSTLKSLVVHVDASPQAAVRLKLAEQLALAHGAHATAVYAVTSALLRYPMAMAALKAKKHIYLEKPIAYERLILEVVGDRADTGASGAHRLSL